MKNIKFYIKKGTLFLTTLVLAGSFTGCVNNINCDLKDEHAHYYSTSSGFRTYRICEKDRIGNLLYQDRSKNITDEIRYMDKFDLFSFEENIRIFFNENNYVNYIEYEYLFFAFLGDISVGDVGFTKLNYDLHFTGRMRDVTYKFCGYKVVVNEKGKETLVRSEYVEDINLLKEEYPFFKLEDFVIVEYSEPYFIEPINTKEKKIIK